MDAFSQFYHDPPKCEEKAVPPLKFQNYSLPPIEIWQSMPGGGPQGTLLGLFLSLILIIAAGFKNLNKNTGVLITKPFNRRQSIENIHMKYVDDLMAAKSFDLEENLVKISNPVRPLNFHERTSHVLTPNKCKMQVMMNELVEYANQHEMKINQQDKSNIVKQEIMTSNPIL